MEVRSLENFTKISRKIIGLARTYKEHARELNNPVPTQPLMFLKAPSSFLLEGQGKIKIPPGCKSLHHEVELAIIIGCPGKNIPEASAMEHVGGYALALDITARDFQEEVKKNGLPWTLVKSWDSFCPISRFIAKSAIPNPDDVDLWLKVNGGLRQSANTREMVYNLPHMISYISTVMTLEYGDVILSGTPAGVGPMISGDIVQAGIQGVVDMQFVVE